MIIKLAAKHKQQKSSAVKKTLIGTGSGALAGGMAGAGYGIYQGIKANKLIDTNLMKANLTRNMLENVPSKGKLIANVAGHYGIRAGILGAGLGAGAGLLSHMRKKSKEK